LKLLIAVITCHKNIYAPQKIRETWSDEYVRFFYGGGDRTALPDEVFLEVPDTYMGLPLKVQAAIKWAKENGYTHFFKCDDDAYVRLDRLLKSGFEKYYYVGMKVRAYVGGNYLEYMHGGAGYWLSPQSMDMVIAAPIFGKSEDGWVAKVLAEKGIKGKHDERLIYRRRVYKDPFPATPTPDNELITSAEFSPEEMHRVHRLWKGIDLTDAMSADEYKQYIRRSI